MFLDAAQGDDWVGVQSYTRLRYGAQGPIPPDDATEKTMLGWEFYPAAVGDAIRNAARWAPTVPIYVTENGIATADDNRRIAYLDGALAAVQDCLDDRIDLGGYFHFCALDGYEWGSYTPKFGLVGWDPVTFQRHPKPSLSWYGQYAASAATASTNDTSSPACTRRGAGRRVGSRGTCRR